jgi:hypothetical protein
MRECIQDERDKSRNPLNVNFYSIEEKRRLGGV